MRETWIPYTNDQRITPPRWLIWLDDLVGRVACKLGHHRWQEANWEWFEECWYCDRLRMQRDEKGN